MNRFALYLFAVVAGVMLAGCADMMSNEVQLGKFGNAKPDATKGNYLASIRIAGYVDGRTESNPRKIGNAETRVVGLSGKDIILDRSVTDLVTDSLRQQLNGTGMQILAKDDPKAMFELSGVVKELKYDVKARDHVLIRLDTTLKDVATGKVIWSGEVEQKDERFAGVSGNSKSDIADYLKQQLGIVTTKTTEAVDSVLQATRPDLFNLTPGTKAIPGVEVFVSPNGQGAPASDTAALQPVPGAPGTLVVRTEPARAKIYLDGIYYGLSPLNIQMAAGIRSVEAKLDGYKNASEKVAIRVGATTELEFKLKK
jgi:hypothetical protein